MAPTNKPAPVKPVAPVAPEVPAPAVSAVHVTHEVTVEKGSIKPANRNAMKPAKAKDVVQGIARERR